MVNIFSAQIRYHLITLSFFQAENSISYRARRNCLVTINYLEHRLSSLNRHSELIYSRICYVRLNKFIEQKWPIYYFINSKINFIVNKIKAQKNFIIKEDFYIQSKFKKNIDESNSNYSGVNFDSAFTLS